MESSTPTTKPSRNTNIIRWVVLAVVFVITVAGIVYVVTKDEVTSNANENKNVNSAVNQNVNSVVNVNTTVSTTGWKTYKNTKYNYYFNYPSTWELFNSPGTTILNGTEDTISLGNSQLTIEVSIESQQNCTLTLIQCVKNYRVARGIPQDVTTGLSTTNINGHAAYTEVVDHSYIDAAAPNGQRQNKWMYYYVMRDKAVVEIRFENSTADALDAIRTIDALLATFHMNW